MLKVVEMTKTINGECNAWGQGTPCFLIRFAGCNLNCSYCDAQAAQNPDASNATELQAAELVKIILENTGNVGTVLITGGEPLIQSHGELNVILTNPNLDVDFVVETNGTIPSQFNFLESNISWVMDCKLPSSGMIAEWNKPWLYAPRTFNLKPMRQERDFIKFVVDMRTKAAYENDMLCVELMASYLHHSKCRAKLVISPIMDAGKSQIDPSLTKALVSWLHDMQRQGITIAVQVQLHKLLGIA